MPDTSVSQLLSKKEDAKNILSKKFKLSIKKPLLGIFLDGDVAHEDEQNLIAMVEGFKSTEVDFVVIGDGNLEGFSKFTKNILPYNRKNRELLLQACDIAVAMEFNDVEEMLLNGVIPVSYKRGELTNYNPNSESGNSFVFSSKNPWSMFAAVVRAGETYKFPYDWKHIVSEGIESVK